MNELTDDETLLRRLRTVLDEVDPTPDLVMLSARSAFSLRRLDAELAELVRDSYDQPVGAVAVRAAGLADVRMLSFEVGPLSVELQVTERDGARQLVAHVTGVTLAKAILESTDLPRELATDDGVLVAEEVPTGRLRLRLSTVDGPTYVTSWVLV
ncbi:MAG TPA: hypothetical protein VLJ59_13815 [Mycobacteriales bacterium]|nr:hypothetical protein [Mycobacteriales bacterium]